MKFIRDIINEKKNACDFGEQPQSAMPLVRDDSSFEDEPGDLGPLDLQDFVASRPAEFPQAETVEDDAAVETETEALECAVPAFERIEPIDQGAEPADPLGNLFAEMTAEAEDDSAPEEPETDLDSEMAEPVVSDPQEAVASEMPSWQPPTALDIEVSEVDQDETQPLPAIESAAAEHPIPEPVVIPVEVPKPATGRAASRSGRVKTRLLGFTTPDSSAPDPFGKAGETAASGYSSFPVGWLVITDGPGRGAAFTLFDGLTQIGRGEGQTVRLNFGDNSISRENHAAIAFDAEQSKFFFGHGGKANLVRLNGRPVLSTEEMPSDSQIRIGETTLRFVALCGEVFTWGTDEQKVAVNDVSG